MSTAGADRRTSASPAPSPAHGKRAALMPYVMARLPDARGLARGSARPASRPAPT